MHDGESSEPRHRVLLEGFRPTTDSLDWRLSSGFWEREGRQAFLRYGVPHLITSDGVYAAKAADVLHASCAAAHKAGALEAEIRVAEFGVGLGLHAQLLLDRFRARCRDTGTDFYDRLTFYATDVAPQMLRDVAHQGTFAGHRDRVRLGLVDGLDPRTFEDLATGERLTLTGLRAVVHNYLLDALPFDTLVARKDHWLRLHFRTWLDATEREHAALAADPGALLEFEHRLEVEHAYLPVDPEALPFGDHLRSFADALVASWAAEPDDITFVHSYGALASVAATVELLADDGFLLFTDFGPTDLTSVPAFRRYGGSRAVGVNFPLLSHAVPAVGAAPDRVHVVVPAGEDSAALHARLVHRGASAETVAAFESEYHHRGFVEFAELIDEAHAARDRNDHAVAHALYAQAHERYPTSWYVLLEWAEFVIFVLQDADVGLALAQKVAEMNPTSTALVHNVLGDALELAGREDEAEHAFRRAVEVSPSDARGHASLAKALSRRGAHPDAIAELALALTVDDAGHQRPPLLDMLGWILDRRDAATRERTPPDRDR